jgi:hypothetical protein
MQVRANSEEPVAPLAEHVLPTFAAQRAKWIATAPVAHRRATRNPSLLIREQAQSKGPDKKTPRTSYAALCKYASSVFERPT